ncbi:hypothetical protein BUE80_DR009217 [Diplocarpon rosae]|nr:hypothetical protein BUE80_DR009217 [Diplocarpon rosae]
MARPFPNTFDEGFPTGPQSGVSYQTNINRQKTKKWTEAKAVDYGGDDWGDDDDNPRPRANSFDADDETRNFSNSTAQPPPSTNAPATRFSQITGTPSVRMPSGSPTLTISTQQPAQAAPGLQKHAQELSTAADLQQEESLSGPGRVHTESSVMSGAPDTRTPSAASDYHARRDFSPSAVPPPLSTRFSPVPEGATETPSQRFPPRKSSSSQSATPPLAHITRSPTQDTTPKPWAGGRAASPGASAQSPTSPSSGKSLSFIRPAEIYKRAEEERRQSIDSARKPSMDSSVGSEPSRPAMREKCSSDSLGGPSRRRTSCDNEDGRRMMPMLATVKERKHYDELEDVIVNEHASRHGPSSDSREQSARQSRDLDVSDIKRHTSQMLPDLSKLSGFGMDMFDPEDLRAIKEEPETTPTTSKSSPPEHGLKLRSQPSVGFNSVVHQAFDRMDDQSDPNTPVSSGVRRTDSESTGTAGISPIMSRVSSTAIPETRNRTSAILEATEPASPVAAGATSDSCDELQSQAVPGFKPGHRRDISTPSPGNSPARSPDLAPPHVTAGSQHGIIDGTSPGAALQAQDESLQAQRPLTEREHSFRPSLPGGWTSYATTAQSETPALAVAETPSVEVPPQVLDESDEDEDVVTPTATKNALPQNTVSNIAAGAAVTGAVGNRHVTTSPDSGDHKSASSNFAVSPGADYSIPKPGQLGQAPAETQMRPDGLSGPALTEPQPHPPLPKDTPEESIPSEIPDYFPEPAVLLKQGTRDDYVSEDNVQPSKKSDIPILTTETRDSDEENDQLRKEIVKSLSPRPSFVAAHDNSTLSRPVENSASCLNENRESSYLPGDHGSYWGSREPEEGVHTGPETPKGAHSSPEVPHDTADTPTNLEVDAPVDIPAPLSPRYQPDGSLQPPWPPLQSRFSWEQSSENVTAGYLTTKDAPWQSSVPSELPGSDVPAPEEKQALPEIPDQGAIQSNGEHRAARYAPMFAGSAAALGGVAGATYLDKPEEKSRQLSLVEEIDSNVSSNPVSPTPPEDEHPARSSPQYSSTSPELSSHLAPPRTVSPVQPSASAVSTGRLIAFREIVSLKSPQERIKIFDETRERFAGMDSGLNDWISQMQTQFPEEHGGASSSWGPFRASMPSGSVRAKFGRASGGAAPPTQQPHPQQHLNLSSPPSTSTTGSGTPPGPRHGSSLPVGSGSQQGFGASGSKITTDKVQAKGKEFLHTAGIFGGKAGKAGKGLLTKGKHKLQAARGGDKVLGSGAPQLPAVNLTQSGDPWGMDMGMGMSMRMSMSGALPAGDSKAENVINAHKQRTQAPRHPTLPTWTVRAVRSTESVDGERDDISGTTGSLAAPVIDLPPEHHERDVVSPTVLPQRLIATENQGSSSWTSWPGLPVQPYDESAAGSTLLLVPGTAKQTRSERSNSDDALFFDAREEKDTDSAGEEAQEGGREGEMGGEKVMVAPFSEAQDQAFTARSPDPGPEWSSISTTGRGRNISSPTSILNRPRGSLIFDDIPPSPPFHSSSTGSKLASPSVAHCASPARKAVTPPAQSQTPVGEKQSHSSSFLPPIRRTSTFGLGFGFGLKKSKHRVPLETEEEEANPMPEVGGILESQTAYPTAHEKQARSELIDVAVVTRPGKTDLPPQTSRAEQAQDVVSQHTPSLYKASKTPAEEFTVWHNPSPSPSPSSLPFPPASFAEDAEGTDIRNTWAREGLAPHVPAAPASSFNTSGLRRYGSIPPSGVAADKAAGASGSGSREVSLGFGAADETNTWGVQEQHELSISTAPLQFPRRTSFPPLGFAVDNAAHLTTNVLGAMDLVPLPLSVTRARQPSFPPLGFAVDDVAHEPAPGAQSRKVSKEASPAREIFAGVSGAPQPLVFQQIPPRFLGHQGDRSLLFPAVAGEPNEVLGVRDRSPRQLPKIQTAAAGNALSPRPLSFHQTLSRGMESDRRPSFAPDLTSEPASLYAADFQNTQSEREPSAKIPPPLRRVNSKKQLVYSPLGRERDPEEDQAMQSHAPSVHQSCSLGRNEQTQRQPPLSVFTPPRAAEILQRPEFKESQVEWRSNRPRVAARPQSSYSSGSYSKEMGMQTARVNSWDMQPSARRNSDSSSLVQRQDSQYSEKGEYASPKPFEQPPSSASRYPDLFRPGQQILAEIPRGESKEVHRELQAHPYQGPAVHAQAFRPRQQTSESQLFGAGPPENQPSNLSRRNTVIFQGRLSQRSSRKRRASVSRDGRRPEQAAEFGEHPESGILSEEGQERKKKRARFFGHLSRKSYSGISSSKGPESVNAHHAGSRPDLLVMSQPCPVRRSFFGGERKKREKEREKMRKLFIQSKTVTMRSPARKDKEKKEKNRLSALGGLFGKSSSSNLTPLEIPQATRGLSRAERQQIEFAPDQQNQTDAPSELRIPVERHARTQSRSRGNLLANLGSRLTPTVTLEPSSTPRESSRARRSSAASLLNGLLSGGRKSNQKDQESEDSPSQGSQPIAGGQALTYTDMQVQGPYTQIHAQAPQQRPYPLQQESRQARETSFHDLSPVQLQQARRRIANREPQYDSVPIPSGYELVRGHGATTVPTGYDRRGHSLLPQQQHEGQQNIGPRQSFEGSRLPFQSHIPPAHGLGQPQQYVPGTQEQYGSHAQQYLQPQQQARDPVPGVSQQPPSSSSDSHGDYEHAKYRTAYEYVKARSPSRTAQDQQRPYQISLPGGEVQDEDDIDSRLTTTQHIISPLNMNPVRVARKPKLITIQRLQQNQAALRRPESPAGYPLPGDTVSSSIYPSAVNLLSPPSPKWPSQSHLDTQGPNYDRRPTPAANAVDVDLGRSNTRRTVVSAISGTDIEERVLTPISACLKSPAGKGKVASQTQTPPNPMEGQSGIKRTYVVVRGRESVHDLYDASPSLPRSPPLTEFAMTPSSNGHASGYSNGYATGSAFGKANKSVVFPASPPDSGRWQEEKIDYDGSAARERVYLGVGAEYYGVGQEAGPAELEDRETAMNATSYPGQEWNPYKGRNWDNGLD